MRSVIHQEQLLPLSSVLLSVEDRSEQGVNEWNVVSALHLKGFFLLKKTDDGLRRKFKC